MIMQHLSLGCNRWVQNPTKYGTTKENKYCGQQRLLESEDSEVPKKQYQYEPIQLNANHLLYDKCGLLSVSVHISQ